MQPKLFKAYMKQTNKNNSKGYNVHSLTIRQKETGRTSVQGGLFHFLTHVRLTYFIKLLLAEKQCEFAIIEGRRGGGPKTAWQRVEKGPRGVRLGYQLINYGCWREAAKIGQYIAKIL